MNSIVAFGLIEQQEYDIQLQRTDDIFSLAIDMGISADDIAITDSDTHLDVENRIAAMLIARRKFN